MSTTEKYVAGGLEQEMLQFVQLNEAGALDAYATAASSEEKAIPAESVKAVVKYNFEIAGIGDFKGDTKSDILLIDKATNTMKLWENGQQGNPDDNFVKTYNGGTVERVGDFNADKKADLLLAETSGKIYLLKGDLSAAPEQIGDLGAILSDGWKVIAVADLDGNGTDDIMWQSSGGLVGYWASRPDGTINDQLVKIGDLSALLNEGWRVIGIGDFNADGWDDVLWQSDAGIVGYWRGAETGISDQLTVVGNLAAILNDGWKVVGIADFDGNGYDDILWQSGDLMIGYWKGLETGMSDQLEYSGNLTALKHENWNVEGVGDFNGDGSADILWASGANKLVGMWGAGSDKNWVTLGSLA